MSASVSQCSRPAQGPRNARVHITDTLHAVLGWSVIRWPSCHLQQTIAGRGKDEGAPILNRIHSTEENKKGSRDRIRGKETWDEAIVWVLTIARPPLSLSPSEVWEQAMIRVSTQTKKSIFSRCSSRIRKGVSKVGRGRGGWIIMVMTC